MSDYREKRGDRKMKSKSHKSQEKDQVKIKKEKTPESEESNSSSSESSDGGNNDHSVSSGSSPDVKRRNEMKGVLKIKREPKSPENDRPAKTRRSASPKNSRSNRDMTSQDTKHSKSAKYEEKNVDSKRSGSKSHCGNEDSKGDYREANRHGNREGRHCKDRRDENYDSREKRRDNREERAHSSKDKSHRDERPKERSLYRRHQGSPRNSNDRRQRHRSPSDNFERGDDRRSLDRRRHESPSTSKDRRQPRRSPDSDRERRRDDAYSKSRDRQRERKQRKLQEKEEDLINYQFGQKGEPPAAKDSKEDAEPIDKEKPNFELSGKLTEFTNTYKGVVIVYNEPPEARKPKARWRLYPFKGEESLKVMHIHRQSAFLIGRDRNVTDIPVDHPSCSKQHAALQYRLVNHKRDDGVTVRKVKPYIIDLDAPNGTYVNNQRIDARRYYELKEQDVLKFGFSTREYVILHEKSEDDPPSGNEDEDEEKDEDEKAKETKE